MSEPCICLHKKTLEFLLTCHVYLGGEVVQAISTTNRLYILRWKCGLRAWSELMIPLSSHILLIIIRKYFSFQKYYFCSLRIELFCLQNIQWTFSDSSKTKQAWKKNCYSVSPSILKNNTFFLVSNSSAFIPLRDFFYYSAVTHWMHDRALFRQIYWSWRRC